MGNTESTTHEASEHPTASVTELLSLIDWQALPAATRETIRTIGPLISEGCSRSEMGRRLGWPDAQVGRAVEEIRSAIVDQCYAMLDQLEPRVRGLVESLHAAHSSTA